MKKISRMKKISYYLKEGSFFYKRDSHGHIHGVTHDNRLAGVWTFEEIEVLGYLDIARVRRN